MTKGSGTRSGLLWEVERILHECEELPDILLMENVPNVHGKDNIADFKSWIKSLEDLGYSNFWQDLNAKNYGVAQNRNRTFMVSILQQCRYEFPKPIKLDKTVEDYLEENVDEKYYINSEKAQELIDKLLSDGILDRQTDRQTDRQQSISHLKTQEQPQWQTASVQGTMQELHQERMKEHALQKKFTPYENAAAYPLETREFRTTGFMDLMPALCARDYKGPKVVVEKK